MNGLIYRFLFVSVGLISALFSHAQNYEATITNGAVKISGSSIINNFTLTHNKSVAGKKIVSLSKQENNKITIKGDNKIALEVNSFSSSHKMITNDFKKMLKSDTYPNINIELLKIITSDDPLKLFVMAVITIANNKRLEILPVKISKTASNVYSFASSHKISLKNYNLEPPQKMMGMVSVNDTVTIDLALNVMFKKL